MLNLPFRRGSFASKLRFWKLLLEDEAFEKPTKLQDRTFSATDNRQSVFREIREALMKQFCNSTSHDVLLYGSRARTDSDDHSDWDILIINQDATRPLMHRRFSISTYEIDATQGGSAVLLQHLESHSEDNNNWLLNACVEGILFVPGTRTARALLTFAGLLFRDGPAALKKGQLNRVKGELISRLRAVKSAENRSHTSPEQALFYRNQVDQLAFRLVYLQHVVDRRWTASLSPLLRSCNQAYPEMYQFFCDCSTAGCTDRMKQLRPLIQRLLEQVKEKLLETKE